MTVEQRQHRGNRLLLFLVFVLLLAVGAQSFFIARLYRESPKTADSGSGQDWMVAPASAAGHPAPSLAPVPPANPSSVSPMHPGSQAVSPSGRLDPFGFVPGRSSSGWDPFGEIRRMQEQMDRTFDEAFNRFRMDPSFSHHAMNTVFVPQIDLADNGDAYTVRVDMPGAKDSDISVDLEGRVLSIAGRTSSNLEERDANQVLRVERRSGQFQRSLVLPGPGDAEEMTAEYKDGVLHVVIPKSEKIPAKRLLTI